MKNYVQEEQAFIDGVEFAMDWNLPIPEEDYKKYYELTNKREGVKIMYRYHIELNTSSDIVEFIDVCSKIPSEVIVNGKDENGSDWSLSAKSFLCVVVMSAHLQNKQKQMAQNADWNTIYVECEEDIYNKISKFVV
ncbi:MAG: hypothetical protein J6R59_10065 [Paludibacteraceae bacterium]|nr:hypothetical protein [Paludibacteraceae bacterium]